MNKNSIRLATAIAAILAAPIVTATETGVELGAGVTYVMFDDDFNVADDIGYRGLLGYRVNERFGMELVLDGISTETDPLGLSFDMRQLYVAGSITLMWKLMCSLTCLWVGVRIQWS